MARSALGFARAALILSASLCACAEDSVVAGGPVPGDPSAALEGAVGNEVFIPAEDDEPFNTLVMSFELGVTVGEANDLLQSIDAELVGSVAGVEGEAEALLVLHTPTEDAEEMLALYEDVSAHPRVVTAAPDAVLMANAVTPLNKLGQPPFWTWTENPDGANWHLEAVEVPSMWNLADPIHKRDQAVDVTVCDIGFLQHDDLTYEWPQMIGVHPHGLRVAGVIGANWGNEFGIDGILPRARIKPMTANTAAELMTKLPGMLSQGTRVVNMSIGYDNLARPAVWDPSMPEIRRNRGFHAKLAMKAHVAAGGDLPVIVASAGDVDEAFVAEEAKLNSPLAMAAFEFDVGNIIVVEDLDGLNPMRPSSAGRYNGHLSAPGTRVTTLDEKNGYAEGWGSSYATAIVSGVVAFMYAADSELPPPTMSTNPALDALRATGVPIAGVDLKHGKPAAPRVDAFAAVMDLDRVTNSKRMLTALCDIDDGTVDGNQRIDVLTGEVNEDQDVDGDGGLGDGRVDMSDFRRFRDWMLQARGEGALDGDGDHPKRDLNLDGTVQPAADEVFPRADFNGDHRLDRQARRKVPGAIGEQATDLEVFMKAFSDPDVEASELPGLLDSGDIHVDLDRCFENLSVARVDVTVTGTEEVFDASFEPDGAGDPVLITVPVGEYNVVVEAIQGSGSELARREETVDLAEAGQDLAYRPSCGAGGWTATRLDAIGPQEINDKGQVLAGRNPYILVEPDGTSSVVDEGLPHQNHAHYLTEDGAFAIPQIDPLVVGMDTYQLPTVRTVSRNGVIAGHYSELGLNRRAFVYAGGPDGGAPQHVLGSFTDNAGYFSMGDGNDWTSNNHSVNDSGTLIGLAADAQGQPTFPAKLSGDQPEYLPVPANATSGYAMFINNAGVIAGLVSVPMAKPILWEDGGYRVIDVDKLEDPIRPRLLSDDGSLIAECQSGVCFYILFPGASEFEKMPDQYPVEVEGGTIDYRLTYIHDVNVHGVMLTSALPVGALPTDPRTTLLLTPR